MFAVNAAPERFEGKTVVFDRVLVFGRPVKAGTATSCGCRTRPRRGRATCRSCCMKSWPPTSWGEVPGRGLARR
jgi:hypothetical protein